VKRGGYLKRSSPMLRGGSALRRGAPLKRGTPINQVNVERLARRRAVQFSHQSDRCHELPCCACGIEDGHIQAAHIKSRASGGKDRANIVPLCFACHGAQGQEGIDTFQRRREIDLQRIADEICDQLEREGVTWTE